MTRIPRFSIAAASIALMVALSLLTQPEVASGQSAWYEGFEGMEPSWKSLGGDGQYVIRHQQRTPEIRRTGERSEWISVVGNGGTYVYVGHDVGRPRIIDELAISIQIRADRPGIQLLAEVTLPRTRHPQTGEPLTTFVRGSSYSAEGKWQQLRIDNLPQLLTSQTRILRNEFSRDVDAREAYISRIVLNVYGGPGATNVWIDDLDIAGYVEAPSNSTASQAAVPASTTTVSPGPWQRADLPTSADNAQRRVSLDRSILLVDQRPFFVRAIRWRGEPLSVLKGLGFNTVWLERLPSADLLAEADRTGMWLISPAPLMLPPSGPTSSPAVFGPEYRSVLAWDLGEGLGVGQKEAVRIQADRIRAADNRLRRPLIARPETNLRDYSRIADILVIGRPALGSSLELSDYAQWLRLRPQLARPGTPVWVAVPTGPDPTLVAQWEAMSSGSLPMTGFSSEQLRLITYLSCAGGARGLLFESHLAMDSTDPSGEVRRVTLELLNLELTLSEPWFAGGNLVAMADPLDRAKEILAPVFQTKRSRLVIPIWTGRGAGQVPSPSPQRAVSIRVPGVPEADEAYEMAPGRLRWAHSERVTAGTRITIDGFALTAQVLITQDQLDRRSRSERAIGIGRRAAELQRRLMELKNEQIERLIVPLSLAAPSSPQLKALEADLPALRRAAQESMRKCDSALAGNNFADAYDNAEEAMRPFQLLAREHWLAASQSVTGLASSPMLATFATLPDHWTLLRNMSRSAPSGNLLPGGDFEDLQTWLGTGWEHLQYPGPGVNAHANLAQEAAHSGNFGLGLVAAPTDPNQVPQLVESPPVMIVSPPVLMEAGSLVAIRGWAKIPEPIQGGADGLVVMDSMTGRILAERIRAKDEWQEFVLYRMCPRSGPVRVTFAMSGIGTAYVDDVAIQRLPAPPVPRSPTSPSVAARY